MAHLGGSAMFLGNEAGFGRRESVADFARVLGEYADVVVVRANRHQTVVEIARHCTCSVINGLTDFGHPCQALADLYTIRELVGKLQGHTLAWIGDANNVARSLAIGCGKMGMSLVMATPKKYQFDEKSLAWIKQQAPELNLVVTTDPREAVRDAVAIYTDVWASMGQESEKEVRRREFVPYQVNAALMARAQKGAFFMHCLPAHRGEEVTDDVIDGPQSVVIQQAGNRMHVQKGIWPGCWERRRKSAGEGAEAACGSEAHASRPPPSRSTSAAEDPAAFHPVRPGQRADPGRPDHRALHGQRRRTGSAVDDRPAARLDHRRVWHVARQHQSAKRTRAGREARRPHDRNPATGGPQPPRRGRSGRARPTNHHARLRRAGGRRRHAHPEHHRRADRIGRCLASLAAPRRQAAASRHRGRGERGHSGGPARSSISTMRKILPPRSI